MTGLLPWERLLWSGRPWRLVARMAGERYMLTDFRLVRMTRAGIDEIALDDVGEIQRTEARLDRLFGTSTISIHRGPTHGSAPTRSGHGRPELPRRVGADPRVRPELPGHTPPDPHVRPERPGHTTPDPHVRPELPGRVGADPRVRPEDDAGAPPIELRSVRRGAQLAALVELLAGDPRAPRDPESVHAALAWEPRAPAFDLRGALGGIVALLIAIFAVVIGLRGMT